MCVEGSGSPVAWRVWGRGLGLGSLDLAAILFFIYLFIGV